MYVQVLLRMFQETVDATVPRAEGAMGIPSLQKKGGFRSFNHLGKGIINDN